MVKVIKKKPFKKAASVPFVSSMAFVPLSALASGQVDALREELTVKVSVEDPKNPGEYIEKVITNHSDAHRGYIGLPRQFGLSRFSHLDFEDRTVSGSTVPNAYEGIKRIKPRDEQQQAYFREIANICNSKEFTDYIAVAKTGSGKTAAAINAAITTGKPQLIVVHTNRLKEGWLGSLQLKNGLRFFCGEEFVNNYVGVIQQDQCDYRNKLVGIALVHSLARRRYPTEFYTHWHGIHFDELHKHTAPAFSHVPMLFPQKVRGGMTATLREDALKKIAEWHFGPVRVKSEQEVLKPHVYICTLPSKLTPKTFNTFNERTELTSLTQLDHRNDVIAQIAYHRGYRRKRQVLIIGDRVHQLQDIYKRLRGMGVKWSALGLYTGKVYTGKYLVRVYFEGQSKGLLIDVDGVTKFANRKEAKIAFEAWRDSKDTDRALSRTIREIKYEEDYYNIPDTYYRRMEQRCSIFLTTYGIFEAGNDIARLDMGIEATPRSDPRQPLGRILRLADGKATPEWYSLSDEITYCANGEETLLEQYIRSTVGRIERYRQQGAKIIRVSNVLSKFT